MAGRFVSLVILTLTLHSMVGEAGQATYNSLVRLYNSPSDSTVPGFDDFVVGDKNGFCFSLKAPNDRIQSRLAVFFRKVKNVGDPDALSEPALHEPNPELSAAVFVYGRNHQLQDLVDNGESTTGGDVMTPSFHSRVVPLRRYPGAMHGEWHFQSYDRIHLKSKYMRTTDWNDSVVELRKSRGYLLAHVVYTSARSEQLDENGNVVWDWGSKSTGSEDYLCYF